MNIRQASGNDGAAIAQIFNYYILNTATILEIEPLSPKQTTALITSVSGQGFPFYVVEDGGKIVGFYYLNNWLTRKGFSTTVELVVYVSHEHLHKGYASALTTHMIEKAKQNPAIHSVVSMVTKPSTDKSVGILKKFGFEKAAEFPEIGRKFNEWQHKEVWRLVVL